MSRRIWQPSKPRVGGSLHDDFGASHAGEFVAARAGAWSRMTALSRSPGLPACMNGKEAHGAAARSYDPGMSQPPPQAAVTPSFAIGKTPFT
jgi:hypothetical protein